MRVDRIQVDAFGRLQNFDSGPDSLAGLVVVLGPNEAGKSTLFSFLTTALFGFHPATRERNPHVPWGADRASGRIHVGLESGGCAEIERTLRSQAVGRLTAAGRVTELRNHPAPWVTHVPRTVFRQVFAITLGELAGLDEETWARIQDKMIGSMGAADLNSARSVADALEREAGEIWRPNRRGRQRLRELQAELRELRGRRTEALVRDARIRRLVEEREGVHRDLQELRERRQLHRGQVHRGQSLLPVKRQLQRIEVLRAEGGSAEDLRGLPDDPAGRLEQLEAERAEVRRLRATLTDDIEEREATAAAARASAAILEQRDAIVHLAARAVAFESDRARGVELESEIHEVEARLDGAAQPLLSSSWRDVPGRSLQSLQIEVLRERIRGQQGGEVEADGWNDPVFWGSLVLGVVMLGWGLTTGRTLVSTVGAASLAAGATWWLSRRRPSSSATATGRTSPGVAELLHGVPLLVEHRDRPTEALVSGLERVRDLARTHGELSLALQATRDRMLAVEADARALSRSLGLESTKDPVKAAHELDRELRRADRLRDSATEGQRRLVRLQREREELANKEAAISDELHDLLERAKAIAPGDAMTALSTARDRLVSHDRADQLEGELVRAHPDLDELREQIGELDGRGHDWSVDDEALARARARIEELDERIEDLLTLSKSLEAETEHLREDDTVDAVDSEVASLREAEALLVRERDRKWVLAQLIREADRRFREEHQPDLVRRAGSYLEHLTGGRYDRLVVDETHDDHLFHLVGPGLPAPVPLAPPVSTGTLEQAYLSLRLAIVDHLDQGGERLPLFVDEILVNWDDDRRGRGAEVLTSISKSRQVFVFTCHPSVAAELEERGGQVLELPRR